MKYYVIIIQLCHKQGLDFIIQNKIYTWICELFTLDFIMIEHPNFDPVALQLGPVSIHWYGIMYLLGFASIYLLAVYRAKKSETQGKWNDEQIGDLIFYGALGAVLGGRLGYILFYKFGDYIQQPLEIFKVWEGGMAFHGGLIGVIFAFWLFAKHQKRGLFEVADFVAPMIPVGLFFGRLGNFINQELWGKVTDLPWAMIFKGAGPLPRHPSMLYEAILEGVLLFIILWFYSARARKPGTVSGLFLCGYALFRFLVEFVREPDIHLGYLAFDWFTMGQLLSILMFILGLILIFKTNKTS